MPELIQLSTPDKRTKKTCMEAVDRFENAYAEAGRALRTIKDNRLYQDECGTFEEFCQKHWNFSRQRAYQLIDASKVLDVMTTVVDTPPANERQVRELAKLPTEQAQATVWATAVETAPKDREGNPKVTAAHIKKVAEEFLPQSAPVAETPAAEEPAPIQTGVDAEPEKVDGGYEPHECLPDIKAFEDIVGKGVRKKDDIRRKLGECDETISMAAGLDQAFRSAGKLKARLKGPKR